MKKLQNGAAFDVISMGQNTILHFYLISRPLYQSDMVRANEIATNIKGTGGH